MEPAEAPTLGPKALADRATEELTFIRRAMERASDFTAVPGWGGVAMGLTALAAAAVALQTRSASQWLGVWVAAAVVAASIGVPFAALVGRCAVGPAPSAAARNQPFERSTKASWSGTVMVDPTGQV